MRDVGSGGRFGDSIAGEGGSVADAWFEVVAGGAAPRLPVLVSKCAKIYNFLFEFPSSKYAPLSQNNGSALPSHASSSKWKWTLNWSLLLPLML